VKTDKFAVVGLIVLWIVGALVLLGILGAIIWVAVHFLSKIW